MEIRQTKVVSRVRFKLEIPFFNDCFQVGYVLRHAYLSCVWRHILLLTDYMEPKLKTELEYIFFVTERNKDKSR